MTQRFIELGDVSLRVDVAGPEDGRSLILIHELSGSLESWDYVAPELEPRFRILRADQRGAGLSEKVRKGFTVDDLALDCERLAEATGLRPPFYVAGIASGAAVAVAFARRRSADVAALALCSPALGASPERRAYLLSRAERAAGEGMRAVVDVVFENSYQAESVADRAVYEAYRGRFLAIDPECYRLANRMLSEASQEGTLIDLPHPTLLLAGRSDKMRPPAAVQALAAMRPSIVYETVDSAHIMILQAPHEVAARIASFFARI